jgi:hypothetical protein
MSPSRSATVARINVSVEPQDGNLLSAWVVSCYSGNQTLNRLDSCVTESLETVLM